MKQIDYTCTFLVPHSNVFRCLLKMGSRGRGFDVKTALLGWILSSHHWDVTVIDNRIPNSVGLKLCFVCGASRGSYGCVCGHVYPVPPPAIKIRCSKLEISCYTTNVAIVMDVKFFRASYCVTR